jgi:hypothetical protein
MNPVPATATALPFCNPVDGVTVMAGVAAEAVVAKPKDVRPPRINVPMAILVINRLMVYVLPIAVITISLARGRVESVTSTCNGHFVAR